MSAIARNGLSPQTASVSLADYQAFRSLETEVIDLRRQNAALARSLRYSSETSRIAQRARDDAMLMLHDLNAGLLISRGRNAAAPRHESPALGMG